MQVTVFGAWLDEFFFSEPRVCEGGWEKFEESCYLFSLSSGTWDSGKVWISKQSWLCYTINYSFRLKFFYFIKINMEFLDLELFHCNVHYKFISTRTSAIWVAGQFHMESSSLEMDQCTFVMRPCTCFLTIALVFVFIRYLQTEDINKWS